MRKRQKIFLGWPEYCGINPPTLRQVGIIAKNRREAKKGILKWFKERYRGYYDRFGDYYSSSFDNGWTIKGLAQMNFSRDTNLSQAVELLQEARVMFVGINLV